MSDEKIERIDRRVNELLIITGKLVTAVSEHTEQLKIQGEQIKAQGEQIKRLTDSQQTISNQLADVVRVLISTDQKVEGLREEFNVFREEMSEFRAEANEKFEKLLKDSDRLNVLDVRVTKIEETLTT